MIITEENYVELAEKAIQALKNEKDQKGRTIPMVTTSKIRNLLAMTSDIYNEVLGKKAEALDREVVGRIQYLKIRFVYESGREPAVRRMVEKAQILKLLDEIMGKRSNYILFCRYMEALVAYHRFYGGKDN